MTPEQLAVSAAMDLYGRGRLPTNEDAAAAVIAKHAEDYMSGRVRFPIVDAAGAEYALTSDDDGALDGLGKALKKAVKKVKKVVKKVAAPVLGVTAGVMTGNPQVGLATAGLVAQVTAKPLKVDEPMYIDPTAQAVAQPQYLQVQPPPPSTFGIPDKYIPIAAVILAAMLARN